MNIEELMQQTVTVSLACPNQECEEHNRTDTDELCIYFDVICGNCETVIRLGESIPQ